MHALVIDPSTAFGAWPSAVAAVAGLLGVGMISSLWKDVRETRDNARDLMIAVYGSPSSKEPNGMKRELAGLRDGRDALVRRLDEQMQERDQYRTRLGETITRHNNTTQSMVLDLQAKWEATFSEIKKRPDRRAGKRGTS